MLDLADRLDSIKESPTFAVLAKASNMQKSDSSVIILASGEPDFDTPDYIKDCAISAIKSGKTKYTPVAGIVELKEAVINKFQHENSLFYEKNEVIISAGAKQAIYNALMAIVNSGDEVIIPIPYWVSYPDMVLLTGGVPVYLPCDENFKISATELSKFITHKTKAIILNSPSNPTGAVYTMQELKDIANVLLEHPNIYIVSDDIYEHIVFDGASFVNIVNACPELMNRTIVVNGVSKAYAMTGWRIGFAACKNSKLIKSMEVIQSQSTSNPCSISQYAALCALTQDNTFIAKMLNAFAERRNFMIRAINELHGFSLQPIHGAFYAFCECKQAMDILYKKNIIPVNSDVEFANYLLEQQKLAVIPGSAFGLDCHIRLSFATSMNVLESAVSRMQALFGA